MYLSGVKALHIEQGFADPLLNCLRLQRVIRSIKRTQGSPSSRRLPITDDLMLVIWKSLNLQLPDHCMFWAACTLRYFKFLRSAEFTVPSLASFSPSVHLGVQDLAVDSSTAPSCICITIKASKTDAFRKGCSIHNYWLWQVSLMRCSCVIGLRDNAGWWAGPSVSLSKRATSLAYSTHQLASANHGLCWNFG